MVTRFSLPTTTDGLVTTFQTLVVARLVLAWRNKSVELISLERTTLEPARAIFRVGMRWALLMVTAVLLAEVASGVLLVAVARLVNALD